MVLVFGRSSMPFCFFFDSASWVMRTSVEPQCFCISSQSHRFLLYSCTQDFPVALTLTMTHHFNATRANVSCASSERHQRLPLFWSRQRDSVEVFPFPSLAPLLEASHPSAHPLLILLSCCFGLGCETVELFGTFACGKASLR